MPRKKDAPSRPRKRPDPKSPRAQKRAEPEAPRGRKRPEPEAPRPRRRPEPETYRERGPVEPTIEVDVPRCGYVALVGRPNVGKSTILNRLLGEKLAATTYKPQTTRRNLLGVLNPPGAQLLLLDTPGHHSAKGPLNRYMVAQAEQAIAEADVVGYVVEARGDERVTPGNERVMQLLLESNKKIVLLVNKVDRVKDKKTLLLQIDRYQKALGSAVVAVVPISATRGVGLEDAVRELALALPEGEPLFDADQLTTESERSIVAELLREQLIFATKEELPYSMAVTIDAFEDDRPKLVRIIATIHVERDSQKGIVIGRGGERLKEVGTSARLEIEALLGARVFLEMHVRVTGEWSSNSRVMAELGYGGAEGLGASFSGAEEVFDDLDDDLTEDLDDDLTDDLDDES